MLNALWSLFSSNSYVHSSASSSNTTTKDENSNHLNENLNSTRNFSDQFDYYYNIDDDLIFYKRHGWSDYYNSKLGLIFKYPAWKYSHVEVLPYGDSLASVQLRAGNSITDSNHSSSESTIPNSMISRYNISVQFKMEYVWVHCCYIFNNNIMIVATMFNIEDIQSVINSVNVTKNEKPVIERPSQILTRTNPLNEEEKQSQFIDPSSFGPREYILNSIKKLEQSNCSYKIFFQRPVKVNSRKAYECKLELEMNPAVFQRPSNPKIIEKSERVKVLLYWIVLKCEDTNKFFIFQHMLQDLDVENFDLEFEEQISHIVRSVKIVKSQQTGAFTLYRNDKEISLKLLDESWQGWNISGLGHNFAQTKKSHKKNMSQREEEKIVPLHLKDENVLMYLVSSLTKEKIGKEIAFIQVESQNQQQQYNSEMKLSFEDYIQKTRQTLKEKSNTVIEIKDRIKWKDSECSEGILFAYVSEMDSFPVHLSKLIPTPEDSQEIYNVIECHFKRGSSWYKIFSRSHHSLSLSSFRQSVMEQIKMITFHDSMSSSLKEQSVIHEDNTFLEFESMEHEFSLTLPLLYQISARQSLGNTPVCQFFSRFSMDSALCMFETQVYFERLGPKPKHESLLSNEKEKLKILKQSLLDQMIRNIGKPVPLILEKTIKIEAGIGNEAIHVAFSTPMGSPIHQKNLIHVHTSFLLENPSPLMTSKQSRELVASIQPTEEENMLHVVTIKTTIMDAFYNDFMQQLFENIHRAFKYSKKNY